MAILLTTTIGPAGDFPLVQAEDIGMPDGSRLDAYTESMMDVAGQVVGQVGGLSVRVTAVEKEVDEISVAYPLAGASLEIKPEKYYEFGEVGSLAVTLVEVDDNKAHEYYFEFIPTEDFTELTVTPTPKWVKEPQYPVGKTCQVSILRGIGVMVNA